MFFVDYALTHLHLTQQHIKPLPTITATIGITQPGKVKD